MDTLLGGIKAILGKRIATSIAVDRFFPSAKLCSCCKSKKEVMQLSERIYVCTECGAVLDRDWNAALNSLDEGLNKLPAECRKAALVLPGRKARGDETATPSMKKWLHRIPHVRASLVVESGSLTASA